ncbi:Uncharacterised protein [Enterobacter ludwigii]|nr:Uncharacterised protein [Enterobacter ludwigii]
MYATIIRAKPNKINDITSIEAADINKNRPFNPEIYKGFKVNIRRTESKILHWSQIFSQAKFNQSGEGFF